MISVIIPVYNTEKYLNRCIDSVLNSAYHDFEVILVDDGSTDKSPEICEEYSRQDSRIKVLRQENQGVSAARNRGLCCCQGEWVVFVDSDDYISEHFLGMAAREEYRAYDYLLFDFTTSRQEPAAWDSPAEPLFLRGSGMQKLLKRVLVPRKLSPEGNADFRSPCARAYKKSVIDKYSIRFSTDLAVGEDLLFNMEYLLRAKSCVYLPVSVYLYDIHTGSATHGFRTGLVKNHATLQRELKKLLITCGRFSSLEREFYSYSLENMTYVLVWEVFSPLSPRPWRTNLRLCHRIRKNRIYQKAMREHWNTGILPRRILVLFFRMRCCLMTALICKASFAYLEKKSF